MRGRWIGLSRPRRFLTDLLHFAAKVPTVPVQRKMALNEVVAARAAAADRPGWPAVFLKAYATVAAEMPVLRRAYVALPWSHLVEYPKTIASLAVERWYEDEPCVFFGRIRDPQGLPLTELQPRVRHYADAPLESIGSYRQMLRFAAIPPPPRRALLWPRLHPPRPPPGQFRPFPPS